MIELVLTIWQSFFFLVRTLMSPNPWYWPASVFTVLFPAWRAAKEMALPL